MWDHRRKKLVANTLQWRLLVVYLVYSASVIFLFAGILFAPLIVELRGRSLPLLQEQQLADQFLALHIRLWPALLIVFALLVVHAMVLSHRIAGPASRIRRTLKAIGEGDLRGRIVLRRTDYLDEEVEAINEMMNALGERIGIVKNKVSRASVAVDAVRRSMAGVEADDLRRTLAGLVADMMHIEAALDQFKVSSNVIVPSEADTREEAHSQIPVTSSHNRDEP